MTEGCLGSENTRMNRRTTAVLVAFGVGLLLFGCSEGANPEAESVPPLDQMPLMLAGPLFESGYELAGYYELDADGDGVVEALAVLTLRPPMTEFSTGSSRVLLFGRHGGAWSLNDGQRLDGANARVELRDLTGDGFPELLVFTEEADTQVGDFVVPLRYTDHLSVFTYTPGLYLAQLGTFSSSLSGEMRPRSTVGEWEGRPAIQTARDLPPVGRSVWRPVRVETFAWDGQGFVSVDVGEERRVSPIISWLVRRNAPWAAVFLTLGGAVSALVTAIAHRSRLQERWIVLGVALLFTAGGVGLGLAEAWLCVPALVLIALAGFWVGRQVTTRLVARNLSTKPTPAPEDEASAFRMGAESVRADEGDNGA
jgi:hypothetical protein